MKNWEIEIIKHGARYWGFVVRNPEGGSYGSHRQSMIAARTEAFRSVPHGANFSLVINGKTMVSASQESAS